MTVFLFEKERVDLSFFVPGNPPAGQGTFCSDFGKNLCRFECRNVCGRQTREVMASIFGADLKKKEY